MSRLTAAGVCRTASPPTHASLSLAGLLRGDTLPNRDGYPGATGPADPSVVAACDLPPGLCAEGPGPHESQVSRGTRHAPTARLVLLRCQAARGLRSCGGGSPAVSAQMRDDGRPCMPALGSGRGLAAPRLVRADARLCRAVLFTGSLRSVCRMDNGEACFILSSRNEVDRTAAVSQAWGMARSEVIHFSGRKAPG